MDKLKSLAPILGIAFLLASGCQRQPGNTPVIQTGSLKIERLTPDTYLHISYLEIPGYGQFPCNGLVVTDNGEAVVFDTPVSDSVSLELIRWIEDDLRCTVKAVVINHFHNDCLGGLAAFHKRNILSCANELTIAMAKKESVEVPLNGFAGTMELNVGNKKIINRFFGEGHTADNIVSYIPDEKMLFGGCLIKEVGAGKGNLADANTEAWSNTIKLIKQAYPDLEHVIPGHGSAGGPELLDFTIALFAK